MGGGRFAATVDLAPGGKVARLGATVTLQSLELDTAQALTTIGKAVGGLVLFGGVGIVAGLAGEKGEENLCEIAREAARTGEKLGAARRSSRNARESNTGQPEPPAKGVEKTLKGIGDTLKGLFGNQRKRGGAGEA